MFPEGINTSLSRKVVEYKSKVYNQALAMYAMYKKVENKKKHLK
jgi:hypothetical protein